MLKTEIETRSQLLGLKERPRRVRKHPAGCRTQVPERPFITRAAHDTSGLHILPEPPRHRTPAREVVPMTRPARKNRALRKKRRQQEARAQRPSPPWAPSWTAMGAFVASAAFAAAQATPAAASDLSAVPIARGTARIPVVHRPGRRVDRSAIRRPRRRAEAAVAAADCEGPVEGRSAKARPRTSKRAGSIIPPGPLDAVLTAFERLTGITVTVAMQRFA